MKRRFASVAAFAVACFPLPESAPAQTTSAQISGRAAQILRYTQKRKSAEAGVHAW